MEHSTNSKTFLDMKIIDSKVLARLGSLVVIQKLSKVFKSLGSE